MGQLTVYTRAWCPHCLKTLAFLIQQGIPYRELSLTHAPELSAALIERFGDDRVPLFELDGERLGGHGDLLERHARGEFDRRPNPAGPAREAGPGRTRFAALEPILGRLPVRGFTRRAPP